MTKCPHCGREGNVLGRFGCTLVGIGVKNLPKEIYEWNCCGTKTTRAEYLQHLKDIVAEIEEELTRLK